MEKNNIFREINKIQIENIMRHSELIQYFCFLNLGGYANIQKDALSEELNRNIELNEWYIKHCNKLIHNDVQSNTPIIPQSWYQYKRQDVSSSDKKNAVKSAFTQWYNWEVQTKTRFEEFYSDLLSQKLIPEAEYLKNLILDVDSEIKDIEDHMLDLNSASFDINFILSQQ